MRWHYRDPLLAWLFPAFYALHILEEWFGGFPEWLAVLGGGGLPREAFVVINIIGLGAMVLATRATIRRESNGWLGIGIATILFTNGIAHTAASLATATYSPGLFTGVVLYFPLGLLALLRAWQQADRTMFIRGALTGLAVHAAVAAIGIGIALSRAGWSRPLP